MNRHTQSPSKPITLYQHLRRIKRSFPRLFRTTRSLPGSAVFVTGLIAGCAPSPPKPDSLFHPVRDMYVLKFQNDSPAEIAIDIRVDGRLEHPTLLLGSGQSAEQRLYTVPVDSSVTAHFSAVCDGGISATSWCFGKGFESLQEAADQPHRVIITVSEGALVVSPE